MDTTDIEKGIESGKLRDPEVVSLLVQKILHEENTENKRESGGDKDHQSLEDVIPYGLHRAAQRMDEEEYQSAFRWYDIAAHLVARRIQSRRNERNE